MKHLKNAILSLFVALCGLWLIACGKSDSKSAESSADSSVLRVGATAIPAGEILEFVKPMCKEVGITLEIQYFTEYVVPNVSLAEGSSDANLYQIKPFMDRTNADKGYNLVSVVDLYVVPLGLYSKKISNIKELRDGATIAIPADPINLSRALNLLHENGIITLSNAGDLKVTELDIIDNPKHIHIKMLEGASLPMVLDSADGAIINGNYAMLHNLSIKNALFHEKYNSNYANMLVSRADNKDDWRILKLKDILLSDKVRNFINEKYKGEVILVD